MSKTSKVVLTAQNNQETHTTALKADVKSPTTVACFLTVIGGRPEGAPFNDCHKRLTGSVSTTRAPRDKKTVSRIMSGRALIGCRPALSL